MLKGLLWQILFQDARLSVARYRLGFRVCSQMSFDKQWPLLTTFTVLLIFTIFKGAVGAPSSGCIAYANVLIRRYRMVVSVTLILESQVRCAALIHLNTLVANSVRPTMQMCLFTPLDGCKVELAGTNMGKTLDDGFSSSFGNLLVVCWSPAYIRCFCI